MSPLPSYHPDKLQGLVLLSFQLGLSFPPTSLSYSAYSFASTLCLNLLTISISPSTIFMISISLDERQVLILAPNPFFFASLTISSSPDEHLSLVWLSFHLILSLNPFPLPPSPCYQSDELQALICSSFQLSPSLTSLNLIQPRWASSTRLGCSFFASTLHLNPPYDLNQPICSPDTSLLPYPVEQSGVTYRSRALVDRSCRHIDRPDRNHTASTRSLRPAPDTSDLSTWWWEWHLGFNILCDPACESWSLLFCWVLSPGPCLLEPCYLVFDPCIISSCISCALPALLAASRSSIQVPRQQHLFSWPTTQPRLLIFEYKQTQTWRRKVQKLNRNCQALPT